MREAEAGRDEAVANYQSAVLGALQDANTSLARFGRQRQSVQHLLAQQGSTARTLDLTGQRRQAGVASQIDLLDARRRDIDARLKALDGESALLKDFVALQKSLGLGWDLPAEVPPPPTLARRASAAATPAAGRLVGFPGQAPDPGGIPGISGASLQG